MEACPRPLRNGPLCRSQTHPVTASDGRPCGNARTGPRRENERSREPRDRGSMRLPVPCPAPPVRSSSAVPLVPQPWHGLGQARVGAQQCVQVPIQLVVIDLAAAYRSRTTASGSSGSPLVWLPGPSGSLRPPRGPGTEAENTSQHPGHEHQGGQHDQRHQHHQRPPRARARPAHHDGILTLRWSRLPLCGAWHGARGHRRGWLTRAGCPGAARTGLPRNTAARLRSSPTSPSSQRHRRCW